MTERSCSNGEGKATEDVQAPLSGQILDVKVKVGQAVKAGDVLVILEALKLQNEIVAPRDGVITEIRVKAGDMVDTDALLAVIEFESIASLRE